MTPGEWALWTMAAAQTGILLALVALALRER